ncbi:MAG: hypothetical protein AAF696_34110 [Bacteroidota bacterium]
MSQFLIFLTSICFLLGPSQIGNAIDTKSSQLEIHKTSPSQAVFLGYTKQVAGKQKVWDNFDEFEKTFGPSPQLESGNTAPQAAFLLAGALKSFWENGGGSALIISVGTYELEGKEKKAMHFDKALAKLAKAKDNRLLVIPEAILLSDKDCYVCCQRQPI